VLEYDFAFFTRPISGALLTIAIILLNRCGAAEDAPPRMWSALIGSVCREC
jgi:hypothetical protein